MATTNILASIKRAAALSSTYSRGRELVRKGKVLSYAEGPRDDGAQEGDETNVTVVGKVGGSRTEAYSSMVGLDLEHDRVLSHACDCLAHERYNGMCKHTVALALAYLGSRGLPGVPKPASSRPAAPKAPAKPVRPKSPPVRTSPQIERLISSYAARSVASVRAGADVRGAASSDAGEPVDLLCVITPAEAAWRYSWSQDTWALGLKVVRGKTSYVVKNVADLVRAWHAGALVTYGKRLSFVHRRSSFTDRANDLLEMLSKLVDAQASLYAAQEGRGGPSYHYSYSANRVPSKTLPISTSQLVEVLGIMQGAKVVFEAEEYTPRIGYTRVRSTLVVDEGDPELTVRVTRTSSEGFELTVEPSGSSCVFDGTMLYLLGEKSARRCPEGFARELGTFCDELLPMRTPLQIRNEDMQGFCAAVLPALRSYTRLDAPDELDGFLPPVPEFSFRIRLDHGFVTCDATVRYGAKELSLFEDVREGQVVRDAVREVAAQGVVRTFFPHGDVATPDYAHPLPKARATRTWRWDLPGTRGRSEDDLPYEPDAPWFHEDDDEAYFLLFADGLAQLGELGEVMLSERLRNVSVRRAPDVRVDASVRGGLLDLVVASDDMTPAELAAYLASYRRKQRFVRLESGDIVRLDGSVGAVADLAAGLGMEADELVAGARGLPANRTLFVDAMLKRAEGVRFERNRAFRKIVRDFETVADADFVAPDGLRDVLRPYQTEGFKWLCTLGGAGFGGILADDMGLGKTLQLLAYLAHARCEEQQGGDGAHKPSLVVCPASLVYNWRAEAERFCPSLEVACIVGPKPDRRALVTDAASYDLLVTSYDLLRRDVDDLEGQEFRCVALDEAQFVKNSATKAAKAVRRLRADVRLALTGTPIENRLQELWSIFDFLMPGVLGTPESFARRFANPIAAGDEQAAKRLRRLVSPFILRRSKREVLRDLPDKSESVVLSSMEGEQAKLYRATESRLALTLREQRPKEFAGQRMKVLAELTKLRQICCDPHLLYENYRGGSAKLDTCVELVRQAVDGGHQLLLFSQFTSMFPLIGQRLDKAGVGWLELTGATSKEERVRLVRRFQAGEAPVFLISLKAGGTGLNLTAADVVIHYDPWWNLAAQAQATDRAHRIGQTREVSVFKLIAKGTIEERIVAMQEAKADLAESVLGGEVAASTSISREDILALLDAAE